eukprot:scaffold583_cov74-Cylindrotheca_fusiformis.AAC.1
MPKARENRSWAVDIGDSVWMRQHVHGPSCLFHNFTLEQSRLETDGFILIICNQRSDFETSGFIGRTYFHECGVHVCAHRPVVERVNCHEMYISRQREEERHAIDEE